MPRKADSLENIMKRTILLVIGWLAACFILFAALAEIDFALNFFNWQPNWDWRTPTFGFVALVSIVAIWFLARATRDRFSLIASFVVCLILVGFAFCVLPAESLVKTEGGGPWAGILDRHTPSPLWFRGSVAFFLTLPGVIWFVCLKRNRQPLL